MIEKIGEYYVLHNENRKGFDLGGYLTNITEAKKYYNLDDAEYRRIEEMREPNEWKIKKLKITYEIDEVEYENQEN